MTDARQAFGRFLAALQFFVRLPMPAALARFADHRSGLDRAAPFFPLAGLVIGAVVALVWLIAASLLPAFLAAGLALAAGMLLTGGLHEDGLADCADGLGGATSDEQTLAIMRDSRIGAFGAAAIVFSVGLRWAALAALPWAAGAFALIIAHATGRGAIAIALAFSSYARPEGTGKLVAAGISVAELAVVAGISFVIVLVLGGFSGLGAGLAGFAAAAILLKLFERRIGGYTGDALGAMEQAAEIAALIVLAAFWSS